MRRLNRLKGGLPWKNGVLSFGFSPDRWFTWAALSWLSTGKVNSPEEKGRAGKTLGGLKTLLASG